jgi:predicted glutamine amidotransferase
MCRLAAYLGEPLFLEELIAKPRHSLMHQSLRAEEAKVQTNGDGFGIGWYGDREEPGVYRDATPAWSDDNLVAHGKTATRFGMANTCSCTTARSVVMATFAAAWKPCCPTACMPNAGA